ncbi:uncharacterized protein MELLADRAFT_95868 [Melampsora larici-populina 98AG31]|uniref:CxC6 like cysteine cluster associated with KDZ domain-containing protein n=1 Tax=Melampsora larici-populina (strain 98AG31 / pathotype 3-4-7) TaxID=747676 RepID=F4RDJ5_MELLP|nr:uncharacterized protein MELLADRAFT_95868 [Melampsora larici-populina 98AG31]EGG09598.1 hypothetical protein MELLADRAFT_95868 [Melampsora larici-populina 98AG31]
MLLTDFPAQMSTTSAHLSTTLTVTDFVRFINLASEVHHNAGIALRLSPHRPTVLPFLTNALAPKFPEHLIKDLWTLTFPIFPSARFDVKAAIRKSGLQFKLPEHFLRPPVNQCIVCPPSPNLHVHTRLNGYLYDTDRVHSVQTVILDCPGRDVNILHVHCHYYITDRLAHLFRVIQMLAHVSHFNLTNWYNEIYVKDIDDVPHFDEVYTPAMSEAVCLDALELRDLLAHEDRRRNQLLLPATGTDDLRFDEAIASHLERLDVEGTSFRDHYCSSCVRVKSGGLDPDTGEPLFYAVVTDGLTIGHWRCSATPDQLEEIAIESGLPRPEGPCTKPLNNINNRFCSLHHSLLGSRCHVQPCKKNTMPDSKTCDETAHIQAWAKFTNRVKSNFSLTAILNRPGSNLPSDPTVHLDAETGEFNDLEGLRQADEANRAHKSARDGGESKAKGKLVVSRCRTHNDQLVVGCCGIVLARKTFYHSESVSAVKCFLEDTFPQGMPEVVFYDNACRLTEHIYHGDGDSIRFQGTVIPVDPFHHCSHAESNEFCKMFTDPKLFPDIQEDGRWVFNASAAELTNIWYGGFARMCRNMHSLRYNFFLEQMVHLRNVWLTKKLNKRKGMMFMGNGYI